jgi:hypothetical protein
MNSSKNGSGEYLVTYCTLKYKTVFSPIFKSISAGNRPFFSPFLYNLGGLEAYLTPLTTSTTTPCLGTSPANTQRTKQFLSRPHGL